MMNKKMEKIDLTPRIRSGVAANDNEMPIMLRMSVPFAEWLKDALDDERLSSTRFIVIDVLEQALKLAESKNN
jgi:hypothetical protein